jgi:hypothetical protein
LDGGGHGVGNGLASVALRSRISEEKSNLMGMISWCGERRVWVGFIGVTIVVSSAMVWVGGVRNLVFRNVKIDSCLGRDC